MDVPIIFPVKETVNLMQYIQIILFLEQYQVMMKKICGFYWRSAMQYKIQIFL